ncbi:MAG: PAS domain S-box protein, partial [Nitrospirae bacterium]|nr:PAS domain S-box protein [Nitrospirota bacterium]
MKLLFSLRGRFILAIACVAALMLGIMVWNSVRLITQTHEERLRAAARTTATLFAASSLKALLEEDLGSLQETTRLITGSEEVLYARVVDRSGRELAAAGTLPPIERLNALRDGEVTMGPDGHLHIAVPVEFLGERRGTVQLGLSTLLMREAAEKDRGQGILLALVAIFLSALTAFALGTILTKSLESLVEATRRIAEGDLAHRVEISSRDEVGTLAASFNKMADALQARQEELASNYEELELSTEELQTAYDQLEQSQRQLEARHQELLLKEEKYRNLIESTVDAIFVLDSTFGAILESNRVALELTGCTSDEFSRMRLTDCFPEGERPTVTQGLQQALREGSWHSPTLTLSPCSGIHIPAEISAKRIRHEGQEAILAVVRDLSEKQRIQQQLLQAEKLSSIGQLVAGVAHEINNPLTGVLGYAEFLLAAPQEEPTRRRLELINQEAQRMRRIMQNLLAFARRSRPQKLPLQVNDLIRQTLELVEYELRVSNVQVELNLDPQLPMVLGDPHQLQQVFFNLANNAHQAMPEGGRLRVTSRVAQVDELPEPTRRLAAQAPLTIHTRQWVELSFEDTGHGIAGEHLPRIFDPFFTTKGVGEGTGLGLSVSYGIVHEHGGEIQVQSRLGEGSTFTIHLPIVEAPIAEETPAP